MSGNKQTPTSKHKRKLEIQEESEEIIALQERKESDHNNSSGRRRLKKMSEVNHQEEILKSEDDDEDKTVRLDDQQPQYKKFGFKNQAEMLRERQAEIEALKSKKPNGSQALTSFLDKMMKKQPAKGKSQSNSKRGKVQLTIEQTMRFKKGKKESKKSDDFIVSDHSDISSDDDQLINQVIKPKALATYQKYNGGNQDENKLIQKAMKLSLASANKHENLDDYAFQDEKPVHKKEVVQTKAVDKKQIKSQPSKQIKVKTKSSIKTARQVKTGPLVGEVVVFTGQFQDYSRDDLIEVIQQLGGQCPKSLVKKCTLLIQGAFIIDHFKRRTNQPVNQTAKSKQAREKHIKIIPYDEIDQYFIDNTGFDVHHHLNKNKIKTSTITSYAQPSIKRGQHQRKPDHKREIDSQQLYPKEMTDIERINYNRSWVQKHKPQNLDEVVGENSQIKLLREWLQSWEDIQIRGNKREVKEIKGWNAAGSINSKAALISGDPGIGKTTTARLLAMQYNFAITEFNASDVRNRSGVNTMQSGSFNLTTSKVLTKSVLIMDEVDGMSSGDRGGVAAIINLIKSSKIPIICICNDRASEKIRSLAAHCLDIRFHKPAKNIVVKRLKSILASQGGSGQDRALEQLVQSFQNDMRQIISYLQVIFRTVSRKITLDALSSRNKHSKDASVMINYFDSTRKLLNRSQFDRMKISERTECFFIDSDIVPLMVHQNLLASARKSQLSIGQFHRFVEGIHGMVVGDVIDKTIRKEQQWGLMPSYGFMSCVYSTEKISQSIGYPLFPSWLGKNSSERKLKRLAKQFKDYIYPTTLCSNWKSVKYLYCPLIMNELVSLLKREEVEQACMMMEQYHFSPLVLNEHLAALQFNLDKINPLSEISAQIKTKLTRLFNKRHEDAKLKKEKAAKVKAQHIKFNPVLQQVVDLAAEQEQQQPNEVTEQNSQKIKIKNKVNKAKKQ